MRKELALNCDIMIYCYHERKLNEGEKNEHI